MPTLRFDGPTLEEAVEAARRQLGPAPKIVAATRVRKGGVGGFFAREHVEVEVQVDGAGGSGRAAFKAPREVQPPRAAEPSGASASQPVAGPAKAAPSANGRPGRVGTIGEGRVGSGRAAGQPRASEPRVAEPRAAEPRRPGPRPAEPRKTEPHWTDQGSTLGDNDDPMSALIEEMADNGPSSVLDLAEKVNAEQGHFSLAESSGRQGGASPGTSSPAGEARARSTSGASGRERSGKEAGRESTGRESTGREGAGRQFPPDALAEREPLDRVTPANVAKTEDRREERRGRRWRQAQSDHRSGERTAEHVVGPAWDGPNGAPHAPSAGFAAVLERIAREAGLAAPSPDGGDAATRAPEPAPASHADLILTELSDPPGLAAPRGPAEERSPTNEPRTQATPQPRATATLDLAEPRHPAARREWTEPLWLPSTGEQGEPRWLAAPAVLARLSQPASEFPPEVAPHPASLAPAISEPRVAQPAPQSTAQPAPQAEAPPAWLARTVPDESRLPERPHKSTSLAPTTPAGQLSELGLALQSLGVPVQACSAVTPDATRETIEGELRRALDHALPPLPAAPKSPSSVVAVVGPPNTVMSTAQGIARDLGASPDEVALATQRKVWRPQDRVILSAEVALEERRSWRWRDHPSVVAIEQDVRPDRSAWTTEILQALEPTLCWGVAKASHKPEDLAAWSEALGGLDVLALVELDSTTTPAAALASPVPVGRLDGEPATPALWATLLCARLMG